MLTLRLWLPRIVMVTDVVPCLGICLQIKQGIFSHFRCDRLNKSLPTTKIKTKGNEKCEFLEFLLRLCEQWHKAFPPANTNPQRSFVFCDCKGKSEAKDVSTSDQGCFVSCGIEHNQLKILWNGERLCAPDSDLFPEPLPPINRKKGSFMADTQMVTRWKYFTIPVLFSAFTFPQTISYKKEIREISPPVLI